MWCMYACVCYSVCQSDLTCPCHWYITIIDSQQAINQSIIWLIDQTNQSVQMSFNHCFLSTMYQHLLCVCDSKVIPFDAQCSLSLWLIASNQIKSIRRVAQECHTSPQLQHPRLNQSIYRYHSACVCDNILIHRYVWVWSSSSHES